MKEISYICRGIYVEWVLESILKTFNNNLT